MKILQINASYKPAYIYGGPTMSVSKLSEQLIIHGCTLQVITTTANGPAELNAVTTNPVLVDGVPVLYFKRITKDHSHFSPQLLLAVWRQCRQFDVVHIHAWWNTVSVLSGLIAKLRGVKVIVSPRGTLSNYSFHNKNAGIKKAIHYLLGRPLLKACVIHTTSGYEESAIRQLIAPKQIFSIPNFVNFPSKLPNRKTDSNDSLKLIFLSRIEEKKGLDILIKSLPDIKVPYTLTIAGNGDIGYINLLKLLASNLSVLPNINWIGFQGGSKFNLLAAHDLLVLPSFDENFGNVVIESLSVGTPVLISKNVGLADYVLEHQLGFICDTAPQSIADVINGIGSDILTTISDRAPTIIRRDFAESALINKYIDMYQQVIQYG